MSSSSKSEQPPDAKRGDGAPDVAQPEHLDGADAEPHLCVRIGETWLAIPAEQVDEIAVSVPAAPLPLAPPHIAGVFNLSGHVIPLIDLESFLELQALDQPGSSGDAAADGFGRIVVVRALQMRVGIRCNRVRGILEIDGEQIRSLQVIQGERLRELARGEVELPEGIVVVLDLPRLLEVARVHR